MSYFSVLQVLLVIGMLIGCRRSPSSHPPYQEEEGGIGGVRSEGSLSREKMHRASSDALLARVSDAPPPSKDTLPPPRAGQRIVVSANPHVWLGAMPGEDGWNPAQDALPQLVSLSDYEIDALPYPNDPALPFSTRVSKQEAEQLCAERRARLCTEAEWENACRGPGDQSYISGAFWDPNCTRTPFACASGYGVYAMGVIQEWKTALEGEKGSGVGPREVEKLAQRGEGSFNDEEGKVKLPFSMHRCAAHWTHDTNRGAGFRCCRGKPNEVVMKWPVLHPPFRRLKMEKSAVAAILKSFPEVASFATDVRFFEASDVRSILATRPRDTVVPAGLVFTADPLLWNPELGVDVLIIVGKSKAGAFIVALYVLGEEHYKLASSFLFRNDMTPVVLAYYPKRRRNLRWVSACWGCWGESGNVRLGEGHRPIIQHE
ncbi:hypothetical protein [Pajaroellobacter abortibovis]|uniref:Sulfatase-modifying factor enzyme domain-containing protein n=1 Tax=Pajaroellobacter abortibovis TaxID=1882918 RepID=A0A1L6MVJ5_9BACT|nr:hypothetical protein [Pajaroellobacter abortibovis]APR99552.1 hypothetical protein BCY86_01795 [Pajaroellobacter abortibovis]